MTTITKIISWFRLGRTQPVTTLDVLYMAAAK